MSILGFYNVDFAKIVIPSPATVSQNQTFLGQMAAKKIINITDGKKETREVAAFEIFFQKLNKIKG